MSDRKKSEDPWDRKPTYPKEPKAPRENPMKALKQWNEDRKAAAAVKAAPNQLPEKCPWCGRDMEQGYLIAKQGGGVNWYPGRLSTKAAWIGRWDTDGLDVLDEKHYINYKTTWLCRACKKMVFTMPWTPEVYDPLAGEAADEQKQGK